jgi:aryl-alcohol dehydrogenase-like predicted oxidoreductase
MTVADEQRFQGEDVRARTFKGEAFSKELGKAEQLRFLVHGAVKSLGQAAIAFCVAHPAVSVAIPGARNDQQMRENAAAGDLTLPAEDLARVAELWRHGFAPQQNSPLRHRGRRIILTTKRTKDTKNLT